MLDSVVGVATIFGSNLFYQVNSGLEVIVTLLTVWTAIWWADNADCNCNFSVVAVQHASSN